MNTHNLVTGTGHSLANMQSDPTSAKRQDKWCILWRSWIFTRTNYKGMIHQQTTNSGRSPD